MENKCVKESFSSKEFADKAIEIYNKKYNRRDNKRKLTRSYLCKKCNTYHLTSQPDNYQTALYKVRKELHLTKIALKDKDAELLKRIHEVKRLNTEIELLKKALNGKR